MKVSVIVTTYNRPDALMRVLQSLAAQTHLPDEVIVADDGSTPTTKEIITHYAAPYVLQHVWQQDEGFRAAKIRNKAVALASGQYLIFIDGDCLLQSTFVARHLQLAEKKWMVAGNRVLLSQKFTEKVLKSQISLQEYRFASWYWAWLSQKINRLSPLIYLPGNAWRKLKPNRWASVKTCNLGLWREDFLTVNGFNENYIGWGFEDSDLVIRLIHHGVKVKRGRFALPILHLWHTSNETQQTTENLQRLREVENSDVVEATVGVGQYL